MTFRNLALVGSLALILGGCVVAPGPHAHRPPAPQEPAPRDYYYSDDDYYDYHRTPSHEGYFYVRIVFIGNTPYYVDDYRQLKPIPPHLHNHFRRSPYRHSDRRAPVFSRDNGVRDGYQMSRIVYLNGVPHYVEDGRVARPLPRHMHERFRYAPPDQNDGRGSDNRASPFANDRRENNQRNAPPAYGQERERNMPPAYDQERERNMPPAYGRERERNMPPAYGQERERNMPPAYGRERERNMPPANPQNGARQQPPYPRDRNQAPAFARDDVNAGQPQREPQRFAAPPSNGNRPTPQESRTPPSRTQPPSQPTSRNNASEPRRAAPPAAGGAPRVQADQEKEKEKRTTKEQEKKKDDKEDERDQPGRGPQRN